MNQHIQQRLLQQQQQQQHQVIIIFRMKARDGGSVDEKWRRQWNVTD